MKEIIFDAHVQALAARRPGRAPAASWSTRSSAAGVARRAKEEGVPLAMPVEQSGQEEFEFQYGDDFGAHIESFDPTFAKVLVRYNPDGDPDLNRRQTERLARLSHWLRDRERKFLFELLVPADEDAARPVRRRSARVRPEAAAGSRRRDDRCAAGRWCRARHLEDRGTGQPVSLRGSSDAGRSEGRDGVKCIVLGRGADEPQVIEWVRIGASVDGFDGFAVGRTLWEQALREYLASKASRAETVDEIARRYRDVIDAYGDRGRAAAGGTR